MGLLDEVSGAQRCNIGVYYRGCLIVTTFALLLPKSQIRAFGPRALHSRVCCKACNRGVTPWPRLGFWVRGFKPFKADSILTPECQKQPQNTPTIPYAHLVKSPTYGGAQPSLRIPNPQCNSAQRCIASAWLRFPQRQKFPHRLDLVSH
jgi:hypothetical protein